MKNINKYIFGLGMAAVATVSLSSCADETMPTSGATQEQVEASSAAIEGAVNGIAAYFNNYSSSWAGTGHWAFAYGAMMCIRDRQTADLAMAESNYDQWWPWEENRHQGDGYVFSQYIWNYYYGLVNTTNVAIGSTDIENATDEQKGFLGAAYAFRALAYLDLARLYEYLPCTGTSNINADGNDVLHLTVPIVTDKTTEAECRNNPRATREEMAEFILSDLDKAEACTPYLTDDANNSRPDLAVVYGLKARCYMWLENYPKAEEYARKAIDEFGGRPMTEDECLDPTVGFNDISKWMLGSTLTSEDNLVQTGIINWVSHMSNQTTYGYASIDEGMPVCMIDRAMYDRISDTDFRKYEFQAPAGSFIADKNRYIPGTEAACKKYLPDYTALKFRPAQGNIDTYTIGSATSYPLMRVEEMYFIEAEAAAHQEPARGAQLVSDFMQTYRDPEYTCTATSKDDVVEEIVFQKRVELWGEGLSFFDIKRLDLGITRGYPGTNFYDGTRYNTLGRPAWMNYCIVRTEANNNEGVRGYNNPDPTDAVEQWSE